MKTSLKTRRRKSNSLKQELTTDPKDANIRFELNTIILGAEGEEATGNAEASLGIGFVSGFLIFFIFMYGAMVMRGVIEEKTNRIVEVIISSVKPFQLMRVRL